MLYQYIWSKTFPSACGGRIGVRSRLKGKRFSRRESKKFCTTSLWIIRTSGGRLRLSVCPSTPQLSEDRRISCGPHTYIIHICYISANLGGERNVAPKTACRQQTVVPLKRYPRRRPIPRPGIKKKNFYPSRWSHPSNGLVLE